MGQKDKFAAEKKSWLHIQQQKQRNPDPIDV